MKAYKLEILVIDFENIGEKDIIGIIENQKYIYPDVKSIVGVDIGEWADNHPLNKKESADAEYKRLFND